MRVGDKRGGRGYHRWGYCFTLRAMFFGFGAISTRVVPNSRTSAARGSGGRCRGVGGKIVVVVDRQTVELLRSIWVGTNVTGYKGNIGRKVPGYLRPTVVLLGRQRRTGHPYHLYTHNCTGCVLYGLGYVTRREHEGYVLRYVFLRCTRATTKGRTGRGDCHRGPRTTCLGWGRCGGLPGRQPVYTHISYCRPNCARQNNKYRRDVCVEGKVTTFYNGEGTRRGTTRRGGANGTRGGNLGDIRLGFTPFYVVHFRFVLLLVCVYGCFTRVRKRHHGTTSTFSNIPTFGQGEFVLGAA